MKGVSQTGHPLHKHEIVAVLLCCTKYPHYVRVTEFCHQIDLLLHRFNDFILLSLCVTTQRNLHTGKKAKYVASTKCSKKYTTETICSFHSNCLEFQSKILPMYYY